MAFLNAEAALLLGNKLEETNDFFKTVNDVQQGRYAQIMKDSLVFQSVQNDTSIEELKSSGNVQAWIASRLTQLDLSDEKTRFDVLATGAACINAFVQVNWDGSYL